MLQNTLSSATPLKDRTGKKKGLCTIRLNPARRSRSTQAAMDKKMKSSPREMEITKANAKMVTSRSVSSHDRKVALFSETVMHGFQGDKRKDGVRGEKEARSIKVTGTQGCVLTRNSIEQLEAMMKRNIITFCTGIVTVIASSAIAGSGCGYTPRDSDKKASADIVDTAVAAGSFGTLVAAVQAAGLVDTLKGDGPFTVFAPTDDAFASLPEGTVESLLLPENRDQLVSILTYHVVSGKVMASDVVNLTSADTVQGDALAISVSEGTVSINNATVVQTDIETSNGVIHVIDTVLLPGQS